MDSPIRSEIPFPSPGEMAELSLLVPSWQANALVEVAESQGLSVAQFIRRLLNQALVAFPTRGCSVMG
jgi:hypothetical protein